MTEAVAQVDLTRPRPCVVCDTPGCLLYCRRCAGGICQACAQQLLRDVPACPGPPAPDERGDEPTWPLHHFTSPYAFTYDDKVGRMLHTDIFAAHVQERVAQGCKIEYFYQNAYPQAHECVECALLLQARMARIWLRQVEEELPPLATFYKDSDELLHWYKDCVDSIAPTAICYEPWEELLTGCILCLVRKGEEQALLSLLRKGGQLPKDGGVPPRNN